MSPSIRNKRDTDSPAARQEFKWTEEKKETLEPRSTTTSDRHTNEDTWEEEGPGAGGSSNMGHQTELHLAQGCHPLQWGRRPRSLAHSKAAWLGSSAAAESHEIPTGNRRGCGAREVNKQNRWVRGIKGNKRVPDLLTASTSGLHPPSPLICHMASALSSSHPTPFPHNLCQYQPHPQPYLLGTQLHCLVEHSPDDPLGTGGCGQRPLVSEVATEIRGQQCRYIQSWDPNL
jgi:hypothetical protein